MRWLELRVEVDSEAVEAVSEILGRLGHGAAVRPTRLVRDPDDELAVQEDPTAPYELKARMAATKAALDRLDELAGEDWTRDDTVARLHGLFEFRRRRLKARAGIWEDDGAEDRSLAYQRLVRELLQAQRQAIVRLRNQGEISNDVMHRIERELDLEDTRLEI